MKHASVGSFPGGRISHLLRVSAERDPEHTALRHEGRSVTYSQLDHAADLVAQRAGRRDVSVLLALELDVQTVAHYYGLLRSGALVIPLNPLMPPDRLGMVLRDANAACLVSSPMFANRCRAAVPDHVADLELLEWDEASTELLSHRAERGAEHVSHQARYDGLDEAECPDAAAAAVLFTSGTTGRPKMVEVSHRAVKANAWQMSGAHRIDGNSVVLCHLPILNPMHTNAVVLRGATQVLAGVDDLRQVIEVCASEGVTHYYSQPVRLDRLGLDPAFADLPETAIRFVAAGSRAIAPEVIEGLRARLGAHVFQGYGQTESSYMSHSDSPEHSTPGSVGFPLAETDSRVVDLDSGRPVAPGVLGELQIRGPQVMNRYLNRPDLVPFTDDGWFRTGDVARSDEQGRVFVIDRRVDVVRQGTVIISPTAIERALESLDCVREAGVVAGLPEAGHSGLCAFVVPIDDNQSESSVLMALHELGGDARAVGDVRFVESLPRMPVNAKVDRKVLRASLEREASVAASGEATIPVGVGS